MATGIAFFKTQNQILQECKNIIENPIENIQTVPKEESIFLWNVCLFGKEIPSYTSELFQATLTIPSSYPVNPPTIRFTIPMFHPNIDSHGNFVCNKIDNFWDKRYNLRMFLTKIQEILDSPEIFPDEMFHLQPNQEAAIMYKTDIDGYTRRVKDLNLTWYSSNCKLESGLTSTKVCTSNIAKSVETVDVTKTKLYFQIYMNETKLNLKII